MSVNLSPLSHISNMPGPAKVGVAAAGGAGIMALLWMITGGNRTAIIVVAVGMVLVSLLVALYRWMLGWSRRRKAAPLERGILDNSASAPNTISEPARRARLDDLRKSFESGIAKFRDSGKNIYSLPWYVLVGEPGSGKTEAIRHCNVGFPPGLQDQLQGAGGTLNMNWWFTNHAIILDTAGRLMFEEVAPGETSEWREFLKLLTRVRPNCPINGMLLVIPVDSLIRDTADAIERKANKIAQQLDNIQRTLGVRFPVFVVVTKCDLINGFREFFDNLTDPQLQHQILGWTNPAPLDQPFSPDHVENHLRQVAAALSRRRQGLLLDPVHTEDPNGRRLDQVDALYAFPESLLKIAPRLRRYLEMIFVAGEWSPKPLFLRGIYFTSSMREGSALDAELAEALKVPIESLPEGRVWERDRAYFLRDLFLHKVFRERGLVTRASNTQKLQRRRRITVMSAAAAGIVLLLVMSWLGRSSLNRSIGEESKRWQTARANYADSAEKWRWQIVSEPRASTTRPVYNYLGDREVSPQAERRAAFLRDAAERAKQPIHVPWIFRPLAAVSGNLNARRNDALRAIYNSAVIFPVVEATRATMRQETAATWSPQATAALAQLLRLQTYAAGGRPANVPTDAAQPREPLMSLDPLLRYVLSEDAEYLMFRQRDQRPLQEALDWLYGPGGGGSWPPGGLGRGDAALAAINAGVSTFGEYWASQLEGKTHRLGTIRQLVDALERFRRAEDEIATAARRAPDTIEQYRTLAGDWSSSLGTLDKARADADAAVAVLSADGQWPAGRSATELFDSEVDRIIGEAEAAYRSLLGHLPEETARLAAGGAEVADVRNRLRRAIAQLPELQKKARSDAIRTTRLPEVDRFYLAVGRGLGDAPVRRYVTHHEMYTLAGRAVPAAPPSQPPDFTSIAPALAAVDNQVQEAVAQIAPLPDRVPEADAARIRQAAASAQFIIEQAARFRRHQLIELTLKQAPASADELAALVGASSSSQAYTPLVHDRIPFTSGTFAAPQAFEGRYHPDAAAAFLAGWRAMGPVVRADPSRPGPGRVLEQAQLEKLYLNTQAAVGAYAQRYYDYWTRDLARDLRVEIPTWADFFSAERGQWEVFLVMAELLSITRTQRDALWKMRDHVPDDQRKQYETAAMALNPPANEVVTTVQNKAQQVISAWRQLRQDAELARAAVLSMQPEAFRERYIAAVPAEGEPLFRRYWADMSLALLRTLANESQIAARGALRQLEQLSRFPLARPAPDQRPLTFDELSQARSLLSKVTLVSRPAPGPGVVLTIGEGGQTGTRAIDEQLELLRSIALNPAQQQFVAQVSALLRALPESNDPGKLGRCVISTLDAQTTDQYLRESGRESAATLWTYATIFQSGRQIQEERSTYSRDSNVLGRVAYPGPAVEIRFKKNPRDTFTEQALIWPPPQGANQPPYGGLWSCIRMIHEPNARRASPDGKVWHVEVSVDQRSSLWIKLEFDSELAGFPSLRDWPAPK
jgi:hypothetical protein